MNQIPLLFLLFPLASSSYCPTPQANFPTTEITFNVTEAMVAPDNFPQMGMLVNGQFPGPEIRIQKCSTLILHINNNMTEHLSIHFHGHSQKGTPQFDGTPHITQDFMPPNTSFTYTYHIEQPGTFIYHAHTHLFLNWIHGALIVEDEDEPKAYSDEVVLILAQCFHQSVQKMREGIKAAPYVPIPDAPSLLINGHTWAEWGAATNSMTQDNEGYPVITVKANETYRFRLIGMAMHAMLAFSIEGHEHLEVIEEDGILLDPVRTSWVPLNPGQRYSVLVKMERPVGNYWIRSEEIPLPGAANGRAILHYEGATDPGPMRKMLFPGLTPKVVLDHWVLDKLHPKTNYTQPEVYPVPRKVDRELLISTHMRVVDTPRNHNMTMFDMNGIFYYHPELTLLDEVLKGGDIVSNKENGVYEFVVGESVQIVFQHGMSYYGKCEQHPWHFHGHHFYVVGQGPGKYDPVKDGALIEERVRAGGPFEFRDTFTIYAEQTERNETEGAPCGWGAVRFIADNPGVWHVHCHFTAHQVMGKWIILYEHEEGKLLN